MRSIYILSYSKPSNGENLHALLSSCWAALLALCDRISGPHLGSAGSLEGVPH